jgi:AcrR family transcriptional regulator
MLEERKKIMKAALDEFAEVGLINSSLKSISDRAKLEPAVARALFVDKETLLGELLKEGTDPLVSAVALAVQEIEDPKELIRKSMGLLDQWLLDHPQYVRLYMRCSLDGAGALQTLYQHSLLPSEFYERLEQIISKGQFRCNDIFILSLLLDSVIVFLHMMRPGVDLMSPGQSIEQITEQRFEAVIDLLENGLFSKKGGENEK